MKALLTERLFDALNAARTVGLRVRGSRWLTFGYVVGLSDAFVLLHQIDGRTLSLNGYTALPLREIADVPPDDVHDFTHRALVLKGQKPRRQPDILLLDFPGLLSSADAHFPLITLEVSHLRPDACYVGRVAKLTEKSVTLREIDTKPTWGALSKYRYKDITRVTFGDGYADALWRVSKYDQQSQKTAENQ